MNSAFSGRCPLTGHCPPSEHCPCSRVGLKLSVSETGMVSVFRGKSGDVMSWARQQVAVLNEWTELNIIDRWTDDRQTGG